MTRELPYNTHHIFMSSAVPAVVVPHGSATINQFLQADFTYLNGGVQASLYSHIVFGLHYPAAKVQSWRNVADSSSHRRPAIVNPTHISLNFTLVLSLI
jgi:hypothetical protein